MAVILEEYEQRAKRKDFPKKRVTQARELKTWYEKTFTDLHPPSEKTISNALSKRWPEGSSDDPARNQTG